MATAAWNAGEVAFAPGSVAWKTAMTELLPAPNSVSRRAETAADSDCTSSQPPALNADDVCVARAAPATAMTMARRTTGRRKR